VSRLLERSFLLGRTMGDAVADEREETISGLILQGFKFAPLAIRKDRSFDAFYALRSDLLTKNADGVSEGVAVRVTKRIIEEEARGH
jgi:hypothetical protein